MRFSLLLIPLALLPLMMVVHGRIYTAQQQPMLKEDVLALLRQNGIREASAHLEYLDLGISGLAPDQGSLEKARRAVSGMVPLRLVKDELLLQQLPSLTSRMDGGMLFLEGRLPDESSVTKLRQLISSVRPDLELDTTHLKPAADVRWPDAMESALTACHPLLAEVVEKLRRRLWLEMVRDEKGLRLSGLLPDQEGLKRALEEALKTGPQESLTETPLSWPATFAHTQTLVPLVQKFFQETSPRRLVFKEDGEVLAETPATLDSRSVFLELLRPVVGEGRLVSRFVLYPSRLHFPGYHPESPVAEDMRLDLKKALASQTFSFAPESAVLETAVQMQLATLAPLLLKAGPAARLCIGGHPDPDGDPETERRLALERAGQVHAFLVEQGLPATDVQIVAFDPVPRGTQGAPSRLSSVEILLR